MKMKLWARVATLLLALLLLPSCAPTAEALPEDDQYLTFADDSGATVTLSAKPSRVAVLFSSLADLWTLSGGEVSITVGETVERGIAPEDVLLVDAGAGKTVNTELLISYEPDLVIGSLDIAAQVECAALLCDAGIPAALFRVESFDDYLRVLDVMTTITGDRAAYEKQGTAQKASIDALLDQTKSETAPRVLFLRAGSSARSTKAKSSEQHFAAAMVCELGGVNIADEAPILIDTLSIEAIMAYDPDLILITTMGDEAAARDYMQTVLLEPTWQTLSAVKAGRVHFLPKELFQYKPCALWHEAYTHLAELMYETNE